MLVITRGIGDQIHVITPTGERISITLTLIKGQQARIGVTADEDVAIMRGEVLHEMVTAGVNVNSAKAIIENSKKRRAALVK